MDSKSPNGPPSWDNLNNADSAPPSYTESLSSYTSHPTDSNIKQPPISNHYSTQISNQLQTLTTQISSLHTQKSLLAHAQDEKILSLLSHEIQLFLSDFAKSGLGKGSCILVPQGGLRDGTATPVEYEDRDLGAFDRVVRVSDKAAQEQTPRQRTREYEEGEGGYAYGDYQDDEFEYRDSSSSPSAGKDMWYWRDEAMAQRLASYLRPAPDPRTRELPPRKEEVRPVLPVQGESSGSTRSFWGRKKSGAKNTDQPPPVVEERKEENTDIKVPSRDSSDRVIMDVRAEEVVFRTENDFGIFGTEKGWSIVLKLRVVLAGR